MLSPPKRGTKPPGKRSTKAKQFGSACTWASISGFGKRPAATVGMPAGQSPRSSPERSPTRTEAPNAEIVAPVMASRMVPSAANVTGFPFAGFTGGPS